jgi:hypothetical protein
MIDRITTTVVVSAFIVVSIMTTTILPKENNQIVVAHIEQGVEKVSSSSIVSSIQKTNLASAYRIVMEHTESEFSPMTQSQEPSYPTWVTRSFGVSVLGLSFGVVSLIYTVVFGFSLVALAGLYLIPISLSVAYILLSNFDDQLTLRR